ncbi:MAG: GAF domain-containing protein [Campylobacterota bacterium]|nr:GAF domain-containing protein [Campylobacterota bacterium]
MERLNKDLMERLIKLNLKITQEIDSTKKISVITTAIKKIIKAQKCYIFVHDKNSKSFWSVYSDGVSYIEIPDSKGILSQSYNTRKTIINNSIDLDRNLLESIDLEYKIKSIISMPVFGFDDECIGVVQLLNKDGDGGFNEVDKKVLLFLVKHFTTFIQLIVQEN